MVAGVVCIYTAQKRMLASTPAVKIATCVRPPMAEGGWVGGFARADDHTTAASPAAAITARILTACLLLANSDSATMCGAFMLLKTCCGSKVRCTVPSWDHQRWTLDARSNQVCPMDGC